MVGNIHIKNIKKPLYFVLVLYAMLKTFVSIADVLYICLAKQICYIIFWCWTPGEMSEHDSHGDSARAASVADDEHGKEMEQTK